MKTKRLLIIVCCLVCPVLLYGQNSTGQVVQSTKDLFNYQGSVGNPVKLGNSFQTIYGTPLPPAEVIGDNYLDTTYTNGKMMLFKDTTLYGSIPSRLDLKNDLIEIKTNNGLRVIDGFRIKLLLLETPNGKVRTFFNVKNFNFGENPPTGFIEVLSQGKLIMGVHHRIWVRQPTYNASLGSGDPNIKIMKEKDFYVVQDGKAAKVGQSKKALMVFFESKKAEMNAFFAQNDLNFKNPTEVAKAFDYYNSLK
ncbi:MAG: hypothetical protein U0Y10_16770 [Spirosomataceae bacterium]